MKALIFIAFLGSVAFAQNDLSYYPIQMPVYSSLPSTCTKVGQLAWLTTAPAGQNVYGSTTAGGPCTWTQLTGIAGPTGPTGPSGGGTGTVTVVGAGNLTSTLCATGGGSQTMQTPSANCTVDSSGNQVATKFTTAAGNPVPYNATTATVGNAACQGSTTGLFFTDCGFVATTNLRTLNTTSPLAGGGDLTANRTLTCTTCTVTIGSGTIALPTTSIAAGTCAAATPLAITGLLTTDVVLAGFNGDVTGVTGYAPVSTGSLQIFPYPTAGFVNVKLCNPTANTIPSPGAVTVNVRAVR